MGAIDIPVNTGQIAILGAPHHDRFRKARKEPFVAESLKSLNWAALDILIIAGDLADAPPIN